MDKIQLNLFENPQQFTITAFKEEDNPCFALFQDVLRKPPLGKGGWGDCIPGFFNNT